tara:strand:+ start:5915 stop:6100 length:186 start_codon:yes stop_codon:yes gene_type:complete
MLSNKSVEPKWKEKRIKEINSKGLKCDDSHPDFEEVQAIYSSKARNYREFIKQFLDRRDNK